MSSSTIVELGHDVHFIAVFINVEQFNFYFTRVILVPIVATVFFGLTVKPLDSFGGLYLVCVASDNEKNADLVFLKNIIFVEGGMAPFFRHPHRTFAESQERNRGSGTFFRQ